MVQLAPVPRLPPQLLVWENWAVVLMDVMLMGPFVLKVTFCGGLVEPNRTFPRLRLWGDNVTTGSTPLPVREAVCGLP